MASTSQSRPKASAAGIVDDPSTQSRVIPESTRADGSVRKERRVKPGFTPAEDISRFRPSRVLRAQEEARSGKNIPGSEADTSNSTQKAMAAIEISDSLPDQAKGTSWSSLESSNWRKSSTASKSKGSMEDNWRNLRKDGIGKRIDARVNSKITKKSKEAQQDVPDEWDADSPSFTHSEMTQKSDRLNSKGVSSTTAADKDSKETSGQDKKYDGATEHQSDPIGKLSKDLEMLGVSKKL